MYLRDFRKTYLIIRTTRIYEDKTEEEIKQEKTDMNEKNKQKSFVELFEHIGEALPQFTLAVIFYYNNYDYVASTDFSFKIFGFLITQTLLSMIFSAISILKGISTGIKQCLRLKAWRPFTNDSHEL